MPDLSDTAGAIVAGGPVAILATAGLLALAVALLAHVLLSLIRQLPRLVPLVAAWRSAPPLDLPAGRCGQPAPSPLALPAGPVDLDDEAALDFGNALCGACEVAAVAIDYDSRIRLWNDGAETLTGWSAGAIMGQDLAIIMPPEDARHHAGFVRSYLDRYQAGGPRLNGDVRRVRLRRRDGVTVPVRARLIHVNRGSRVIFAWLSPATLEE